MISLGAEGWLTISIALVIIVVSSLVVLICSGVANVFALSSGLREVILPGLLGLPKIPLKKFSVVVIGWDRILGAAQPEYRIQGSRSSNHLFFLCLVITV